MGDRLAGWAEAVASRLFGPVFALDATRVGRRTSTFVARWVYLLVLLSVLGVFFYSWWDRRSSGGIVHPSVMTRFAEEFFWVYVITQFLAVAALHAVAGSVRRAGPGKGLAMGLRAVTRSLGYIRRGLFADPRT